MDDLTKNKIRYLLGETRNPQEIHRDLKVKLSDVRSIMQEGLDYLPGWGRLHLQPWIISRKKNEWPATDLACVQEHRRLHDQGRVTMCQGRDGEYTIQYAIPCQRPRPRVAYFYGGSV